MNTYTDPVCNQGFPENWTVCLLAWWIVMPPFIGLFVAEDIQKVVLSSKMILGSVLLLALLVVLYHLLSLVTIQCI